MGRVFNFSPGPAMLPLPVLERVQHELLDWEGRGVSVLEVSHRGAPFMQEVAASLKQRLRTLIAVPDTHEILFFAGGATGQFSAIPMNLSANQQPAYVVSGNWSRKAFGEAQRLSGALAVTDNADLHGRSLAPMNDWALPEEASYLYYTDNETVNGLLISSTPDVSYPIVCDMTSSLLTEPLDVSRYGLIMASAQKNIGPAGLTVVIMRRDLCERVEMAQTPMTMSYAKALKADSLGNTPCTFAWYVADLVCEWVESEGGVAVMEQRKLERSTILYDYIDSSDFYACHVDPSMRSTINVVFELRDKSLQQQFLDQATQAGLHALKGHRAVGGCRASMYNAMPVEGAHALIDFMDAFAKKNG